MTNATKVPDLYPSRVDPAPTIRERVDPVVYGDHDGPLSTEQKAEFDKQGFLQIPDVLSRDEVDTILRELDEFTGRPEVKDDHRTVVEPASAEVRSLFEIHRTNRILARLIADPRIAGVARQLLGSEVYVHQSRVNFKPAFKGKEFSWHSDFETWHTEDGMPRMRALSISVSLTHNYTFNGPLMLIPESHRRFVTCVGETPEDNFLSSLKAQEIGTPDPDSLVTLLEEAGGRIAECTGGPGGITVFDCNTMHGSNSNISPVPRSNVFVVYNSVENTLVEPFAAPSRRPEFIAARDFSPVE
ncbi:MAG: ectoine hydroxylase [Actinomycetota bacterium]